ncbi:ABC transporter ATP-binding protein/permease [Actinomadura sp. ATCC 31491]|uniref:ABC transporter ATP-binding protein/permease n=1 Tax=Actinomadura luzonensis TaxID=2805427 RepID=A0ABT0FP87_9ACTN|nr:ABC transporter ATP-binding protein [Actinomadura luzonensis]MCK2213721.1 ABC transporter ATP-binding protein/permease [Actinomadura luzonensis]
MSRRASRSGFGLLVALLRPRRRPLGFALVWTLVEAVPGLVSGLFVANAVDDGFLAGRPGTGLAWLGLLAAAMLAGTVATRLMFPHLAAVVEPLRDDLVRAVVTATVTRAARGESPDTAAVSRLTGQVETLRSLVSALLRTTNGLGISLVSALAGLLVLSPLAAAVVAGPVLVALAVFLLLLRVLLARQRGLVLADERLTAEATPILSGMRDVAACGAGEQAYAAVRAAVDAQAAATRALARAGAARRLIVSVGAHVPMLVLILAAAPLTRQGRLSAGEVVGAVTYLANGLQPALQSMTGILASWGVSLAVTLRRLAETVVPPPPEPSLAHACPPAGFELTARGLTFAYAPQATPVVQGLDLRIPEGEHLAVVGPSGIGKSTLSLLLTGLRRPTHGQLLFGGIPLDRVPERHLRSAVALVPQEAYVFAGTVRENLGYLCPPGVPDAWLHQAAERVGARALLDRLGGLDAEIGEPGALSAGERQLIALARTYASPARLVVLDEATCHLDPAAEARAETAFAARPGSLVVIAHRISSAVRARRVLLMDGGTARTGSHADLLARSRLYADLVGHWSNTPPPAAHPLATRRFP